MTAKTRQSMCRTPRRENQSPGNRRRLSVVELEGRLSPAVFTVLNTNNSGAGSLRAGIDSINATGDATNTIDASGVSGEILLQTALPTIKCRLTSSAARRPYP